MGFVILQGFKPMNKNQFLQRTCYSTIIFRIIVIRTLPEKANTEENLKVSKDCAKFSRLALKTNQPQKALIFGLTSLLEQWFSKSGVCQNQLDS